MRARGRPVALWGLLAVLGQLAVRALLGGGALVIAPSGEMIGLSPASLGGTPFDDFIVPGVILLVVFGLSPLIVCYALYKRRRRAWLAATSIGFMLLVWLLIEALVGIDRPTMLLNLLTAGALLVLALHPSVRTDRHSSLK